MYCLIIDDGEYQQYEVDDGDFVDVVWMDVVYVYVYEQCDGNCCGYCEGVLW